MMLHKTGAVFFLASFSFYCFDKAESFHLNFLENALNWVVDKVGASENEKSSLTIHVDGAEKMGRVIVQIENSLTQPEYTKRTNLLELAKSLNLTTLVAKAEEAGIDDVLNHEGPTKQPNFN